MILFKIHSDFPQSELLLDPEDFESELSSEEELLSYFGFFLATAAFLAGTFFTSSSELEDSLDDESSLAKNFSIGPISSKFYVLISIPTSSSWSSKSSSSKESSSSSFFSLFLPAASLALCFSTVSFAFYPHSTITQSLTSSNFFMHWQNMWNIL